MPAPCVSEREVTTNTVNKKRENALGQDAELCSLPTGAAEIVSFLHLNVASEKESTRAITPPMLDRRMGKFTWPHDSNGKPKRQLRKVLQGSFHVWSYALTKMSTKVVTILVFCG